MSATAIPQPNAWCFGCNIPAMVAPGEQERRCGGTGCNGIAHGNRFRIDNPRSLIQFPAHSRLAHIRVGGALEVTAAQQGKEVLFDFAGPGELLDLLVSVEVYLIRMGVPSGMLAPIQT